MKVLFATKNPAKVEYYADAIRNLGAEVLTLKDLNVDIQVDESGKDAIENATIKAEAYRKESNMITIAIDDTLFLENVPDSIQPGTNVRRVNGKRLDDKEMLLHYKNIVNQYGEDVLNSGYNKKLNATWVKGIAIAGENKTKTFSYSKKAFYFVNKETNNFHEGYPLDSISIIPKYNKYLAEMTKEELTEYRNGKENRVIFDFIKDTLEDFKK